MFRPRSSKYCPALSYRARTFTSMDWKQYAAADFVVMEFGPAGTGRRNVSCRKITGKSIDPATHNIVFDLVPFEDTVHPVALAFEPPYQELASGADMRAFRYTWEKLTYVFHLSDPAQFPTLAGLTPAERQTLGRYVTVCRRLAGYSAIAHASRVDIHAMKGKKPTVTVHFPDDESQVAAAARFRQINNEGELTSFIPAANIVAKAVKMHCPDRMPEVAAWRKARGELLNRTLSTIVCDMTMPVEGRPVDARMSFDNIHPRNLFNTFFYGDFLHVGDYVDDLGDIQSEQVNAAYHMQSYLISMSALAHLYFGFSVLVEHVLGGQEA